MVSWSKFILILWLVFNATTGWSEGDASFDALRARLDHQKLTQPVALQFLDYLGGCAIFRAFIPIYQPELGKTEVLPAVLTIPNGGKNRKVPAVLIIPSIYGTTSLEQKISDQLCDRRIATIFPEFDMNPVENSYETLEDFDRSTRITILRLRTLLDVFEFEESIDQAKIGLYGVSLGGILGSLLSLIDNRIKAAVLAASGSDFAGILSNSELKLIQDIRLALMRKLKIKSRGEFQAKLSQAIRFETTEFARYLTPKPTFMVMVSNDRFVPTVFQEKLYDLFGHPESITLNHGHVWSLIRLVGGNRPEPLNFLADRLKSKK